MADSALLGEFRLGDAIALTRWLQMHDRQHGVYVSHTGIRGGSLEGPVNGDWMLQHDMHHSALISALGIRGSGTAGLALPGMWRTNQQLSDWLLQHNLLHARIDQVLGLATHKGVAHGS